MFVVLTTDLFIFYFLYWLFLSLLKAFDIRALFCISRWIFSQRDGHGDLIIAARL